MNDKLEKNIYSLLTQLVRDEIDYKRRVGKDLQMIHIMFKRINNQDSFPIDEEVELCMLTLMGILIRNCKENIRLVS